MPTEPGRSPPVLLRLGAPVFPHSLSDSGERVVDRATRVLAPVLDGIRAGLGDLAASDSHLKGDGTPVTPSDAAVDRRLTEAIRGAFPDHGILSEEQETTAPDTTWTWVLDPVDGTSNLAAGLPWWCVSVALCHEGRPVWGVVDAPALRTRWEARAGAGARRNDTPLRIPDPVELGTGASRHMPVLLTPGVLRRAGSGLGLNPRVLGSIALDLCHVAGGAGAAVVASAPHVWDLAAGGLVVCAAGGAVITVGDAPALLPLRPGVDYARTTPTTAAGPDPDWLRHLVAPLL